MSKASKLKPDLSFLSLTDPSQQKYQLSVQQLIKESIKNREGILTKIGALAVDTGEFTGRSPRDRYIVKDEHTENMVDWGEVNIPIEAFYFEMLMMKMATYLGQRRSYYVNDGYACAYKPYRLHVRTISETAYQSLFVTHMLYSITPNEPWPLFDWTLIAAPGFSAIPKRDGTRSSNFTIINFRRKIILIGGTGYAGEIKKAIFSVLNFILPQQGVLPMHCSADMGKEGETALFFGLSGTGKTSLSAASGRKLIGDEEHGWSGKTIFNFEAGCYARIAGLTSDKEPQIYKAIGEGVLLENVGLIRGTHDVDYSDIGKTENTRACYPLHNVPNAEKPAVSYQPRVIFFLTCDASGVLPPMARLSPEQAERFFLAGYTSKWAVTETGIAEPRPVFSACFAGAFLPLHPFWYTKLFARQLKQSGSEVWLINTGWTAGGYVKGCRIALEDTRQMVRAVLERKFENYHFNRYGLFELMVPRFCPGVADALLDPRRQWDDPEAYDQAEANLLSVFNQTLTERMPLPETNESIASSAHSTFCL